MCIGVCIGGGEVEGERSDVAVVEEEGRGLGKWTVEIDGCDGHGRLRLTEDVAVDLWQFVIYEKGREFILVLLFFCNFNISFCGDLLN